MNCKKGKEDKWREKTFSFIHFKSLCCLLYIHIIKSAFTYKMCTFIPSFSLKNELFSHFTLSLSWYICVLLPLTQILSFCFSFCFSFSPFLSLFIIIVIMHIPYSMWSVYSSECFCKLWENEYKHFICIMQRHTHRGSYRVPTSHNEERRRIIFSK